MTENAFMMVDAWEEMTPIVIVGLLRINKFVAANPQSWMLEIFDGFNAYVLSHNANILRLDAKILSLKEEGDASHVNHAYDKHAAKGDNWANDDSLSLMRSAFKVGNTISDQWSLVKIGCYAVRDITREVWTSSFEACNLDPHTRLALWNGASRSVTSSKPVNHSRLQAGESFKEEAFDTEQSA
jgi:hypothetical protein